MNRKKPTEEYLEKEVWWWRPGALNHPENSRCYNAFAFNYELVRRVYRKECFVPFPSLKAPYLEVMSDLCDATPFEMASRPATETQRQTEAGWTQEIHLQWNLRFPDHTLKTAFQEFIDRERAKQNIPKPRPNVGKRNRGLSWRWLELMDLADLKVRLLNEAERSSLSNARARAIKKKKIFDLAIADFLEAKRTGRKSSLVRWVDLFSFGNTDRWQGVWPRE